MKHFALVTTIALVAGCASTSSEKVPSDAKLVYYGPANGMQLGLTETQGGMIYITRGDRNSIVVASAMSKEAPLNVSGLNKTGKYAVYWKPW